MNQYDSTQSFDLNLDKEIQGFADENVKLIKEKEELEKTNRHLQHELDTTTQELKLENEKLIKTNQSLETLVGELKKSTKSGNDSQKENLLHEKEKIISEMESRFLLVEQALQDVKRQNQSLNMDNSNLKFEIEKLKLNEGSGSGSKDKVKANEDDENELTLEEAKTLLSDFMTECDDLKKEKAEMGEKALQMLSDKELELIELRDKLDSTIQEGRLGLNHLMNEVQELKEKIIELRGGKSNVILFIN